MFNDSSEAMMETFLVNGPVDRLAILEKQVRTLLEWQRIMIDSSRCSYSAGPPASSVEEILSTSARHQDIPTYSDTKIPLQPPLEKPKYSVALQILDILERYGHNTYRSEQVWLGKLDFLPAIQGHVDSGKPIRMILPAFPFKSPNKVDKVIGALPDLGEELALAHLNGLCQTIHEAYEPGAELTILSDGIVYSDILGIPDEDVWAYGESLREMAVSGALQHIKFARIVDVLGINHSGLPKDEYTTHASCYRRELIAKFGDPDFDVKRQIRDDQDTCMTYRGYLKFLAVDLKRSSSAEETSTKGKFKKHVKDVATAMIVRGKIFATALQAGFADHVRLSIHPSLGKTKLPIQLIPQSAGSFPMTPWHCAIAVGIDGAYRTVHAADVVLTHELVHRHGRPYCFREKSDLYDWGEMEVSFEHLYPCGLVVRPSAGSGGPCALRDIDVAKLRGLAEYQSPIIARGFAATTEHDVLVSNAQEFGKGFSPRPGAEGLLLPEEEASKPTRDVTVETDDASPIHDTGMLQATTTREEPIPKTIHTHDPPIKIHDSPSATYGHRTPPTPSLTTHSPRFEFSTCTATPPIGFTPTLFAASRLFFQHLPLPHTAEALERVTWRIHDTASASAADDTSTTYALVVRHLTSKAPYLQWHDQWSASETHRPRTYVSVENASQDLVGTVDRLLRDRRVCLRVSCEKRDVVVRDRVGVLRAEAGGDDGFFTRSISSRDLKSSTAEAVAAWIRA